MTSDQFPLTMAPTTLDSPGDTPMSFGVHFAGRLDKIQAPVSTSLNALFEAVANAFDATAHMKQEGRVLVRIVREPDGLYQNEEDRRYVLKGYEVEDNGAGFTDQNLEHFKLSDTKNKPHGKGVGRLLWLHVIDHAEIACVVRRRREAVEASLYFLHSVRWRQRHRNRPPPGRERRPHSDDD